MNAVIWFYAREGAANAQETMSRRLPAEWQVSTTEQPVYEQDGWVISMRITPPPNIRRLPGISGGEMAEVAKACGGMFGHVFTISAALG